MHPSGKDFARWLATIFTGDLPQIVIKGANPTFDDVINAFNAAGLAVRLSSGTSGLLSVIPRDTKTFLACQYAYAKTVNSMIDEFSDHAFMFFPDPTRTKLLFYGYRTQYKRSAVQKHARTRTSIYLLNRPEGL